MDRFVLYQCLAGAAAEAEPPALHSSLYSPWIGLLVIAPENIKVK